MPCPIFNDQIEVHLERAPKEKKGLKNLIKYPSKLFRQVYNTYLIIKHKELRQPMSANLCPMRWFNTLSTFIFTLKNTHHPAVMKALLKFPRKDPETGFFNDRDNSKVFLPFLRDLYPNEAITENDFLLTCHQKYIALYRQPIIQLIGPQNIKKHSQELETIAKTTLSEMAKEGEQINSLKFCNVYSTYVISRLLLGHPGPFEAYKAICNANDFVNKYGMKRVWHQPISEEEKKTYQQSLQTLRDAIEIALTSKEKTCFGSLVDVLKNDKEMSPIQIKSTLLLMYFAGTETTASLLNYLIWQLGRHPDYQEEIFQEMQRKDLSLFELAHNLETVEKLFCECIRLFTPGYVIARQPTVDLKCTIRNKDGKILTEETIKKKEGVALGVTFAGRDANCFANPDQFQPNRFDALPKTLSWLPFGDGRHACPGQWLAKAEILLLVTELVKNYHIISLPEKEPQQKGYMTLKQEGEIWFSLSRR